MKQRDYSQNLHKNNSNNNNNNNHPEKLSRTYTKGMTQKNSKKIFLAKKFLSNYNFFSLIRRKAITSADNEEQR